MIAQIKSDRLSEMVEKSKIKVHENAVKKAVDKEKAAKEIANTASTSNKSSSSAADTPSSK